MSTAQTLSYLFGGRTPWSPDSWVAVDDRVRGGKSQSYLDCSSGSKALFHGDLDIKTLGGAGFASQRTVDDLSWDLTKYDGLYVKVGKSDGKKYTLTLKNEVLPKRTDGREQSTLSWEYDFVGNDAELFIPWDDFKPTYRGKPKSDGEPLDLGTIRRISIMMRSFFGEQEGPFRLEMKYIAATVKPTDLPSQQLTNSQSSEISIKSPKTLWIRHRGTGWLNWTCGICGRFK